MIRLGEMCQFHHRPVGLWTRSTGVFVLLSTYQDLFMQKVSSDQSPSEPATVEQVTQYVVDNTRILGNHIVAYYHL